MLPLAGSGSGSSWGLLSFFPVQSNAEVRELKAFECFFQLGKQKCKDEMVLG